jgi:N-acetylglucosamine malate deacetylase 2
MPWEATDRLLRSLARREPIDAPVAIVVAHPDDETIGAGASLHLFRRLMLLHVTDGAPRDLRDAHAARFATCQDYAAARRQELRTALSVGQCSPDVAGPDRANVLPLADQTASLHLDRLVATFRDALRGMSAVITHAYEGGHPDHDAVAFAVQATGLPAIEMAGYHAAPDGGIEVGRFLPNGDAVVVALTEAECARREAMLACFATQRAILAPFFGWAEERFRPAPSYDFTRPACARTYYDGFDWGISSDRWCALASQALRC